MGGTRSTKATAYELFGAPDLLGLKGECGVSRLETPGWNPHPRIPQSSRAEGCYESE